MFSFCKLKERRKKEALDAVAQLELMTGTSLSLVDVEVEEAR